MSDRIELYDGRALHVHEETSCLGDPTCAVHRPSEHEYRDWPMDWQDGMLVRLCEHGEPHPDPDALAFAVKQEHFWRGNHDCDGCCHQPATVQYPEPSGTRPTRTVVIENSVFCASCVTKIVSESVHDFKFCPCEDVAVDGGHEYLRRVFRSSAVFEDTSIEIEIDMPNDEIASYHSIGLL